MKISLRNLFTPDTFVLIPVVLCRRKAAWRKHEIRLDVASVNACQLSGGVFGRIRHESGDFAPASLDLFITAGRDHVTGDSLGREYAWAQQADSSSVRGHSRRSSGPIASSTMRRFAEIYLSAAAFSMRFHCSGVTRMFLCSVRAIGFASLFNALQYAASGVGRKCASRLKLSG